MGEIARIIRPLMLPNLNLVTGVPIYTFKGWLSDGRFVTNLIKGGNKAVFVPIDPAELIASFARDVDNMAIASFETMYGIENPNELPQSTAWALIRAYYSAFFAAHSILRIFGISIANLDLISIICNCSAITSGLIVPVCVPACVFSINFNPSWILASYLRLLIKAKKKTHAGTGTRAGTIRSVVTAE